MQKLSLNLIYYMYMVKGSWNFNISDGLVQFVVIVVVANLLSDNNFSQSHIIKNYMRQ